MRIAIITDAYFPQINGVATSIEATRKELEKRGHRVHIISPIDFPYTAPVPTYPEIRLVLFPYRKLARMLDAYTPEAIHLATEGPLGFAARRYAKKRKFIFTTAYHTRFPEYIRMRLGVPLSWTYAALRRFHSGAARVMVTTKPLQEELAIWGFKNLAVWPRGVDAEFFTPHNPATLQGERPIFMYMGRIAPEKNLDAFLSLSLPGTMYVIGDGPARKSLQKKYPKVVFTGYKSGPELVHHLAAADVFVFPSLTDTLGLVMLEANACGVPIAALPSQAAFAVVREGENGVIHQDLKEACIRALSLSRPRAREIALESSWEKSTDIFMQNLLTVEGK